MSSGGAPRSDERPGTRDLEREHSLVGTSLGCKQEHDDYPANEWNRMNRPTDRPTGPIGMFSRTRATSSGAESLGECASGLDFMNGQCVRAEARPDVTSELRACVLTTSRGYRAIVRPAAPLESDRRASFRRGERFQHRASDDGDIRGMDVYVNFIIIPGILNNSILFFIFSNIADICRTTAAHSYVQDDVQVIHLCFTDRKVRSHMNTYAHGKCFDYFPLYM